MLEKTLCKKRGKCSPFFSKINFFKCDFGQKLKHLEWQNVLERSFVKKKGICCPFCPQNVSAHFPWCFGEDFCVIKYGKCCPFFSVLVKVWWHHQISAKLFLRRNLVEMSVLLSRKFLLVLSPKFLSLHVFICWSDFGQKIQTLKMHWKDFGLKQRDLKSHHVSGKKYC